MPRAALLHRFNVLQQLREGQVQLLVGIKIVAGLGHCVADDARGIQLRHSDQAAQVGVIRNDALNRGDTLIGVFALRRHRLQCVSAVLRL